MADFKSDTTGEGTTGTPDEKLEGIAEQVRGDIQLGHVNDDVTNVLEQRIEEAGLEVRPEDVETLADEIESDSSR